MARRRPRWRGTSPQQRALCSRRFAPSDAQARAVLDYCRCNLVNGVDYGGEAIDFLWRHRIFAQPGRDIIGVTIGFLKKTRLKAAGDEFEDTLATSTPAQQERVVEVREVLSRVALLPSKDRQILEAMALGDTPFDIANRLGISPAQAVQVIKDARYNLERL